MSRGASARGKERAHGVADSDVDGGRVASVCCARACATGRRRYEERRDTGASVRERERIERVACEKGSGRESGGDDVDDGGTSTYHRALSPFQT